MFSEEHGFEGSVRKVLPFGIRLLCAFMGHILMDETPTL